MHSSAEVSVRTSAGTMLGHMASTASPHIFCPFVRLGYQSDRNIRSFYLPFGFLLSDCIGEALRFFWGRGPNKIWSANVGPTGALSRVLCARRARGCETIAYTRDRATASRQPPTSSIGPPATPTTRSATPPASRGCTARRTRRPPRTLAPRPLTRSALGQLLDVVAEARFDLE